MVAGRFPKSALILFGLLAFLFRAEAVFAKSVTLSGLDAVEIGPDKYLKLQVNIDTEGETVGAVEFDIPFNTEILSGKPPEVGGSVCNFIPVQQPNHIMCGFFNGGFNGSGLLATLVFQGKATGTDAVSISNLKTIFNGTTLAGYQTNSLSITVYGEGLKPTPTKRPIATPTPAPTLRVTPIPATPSSASPKKTAGKSSSPTSTARTGSTTAKSSAITALPSSEPKASGLIFNFTL